MKPMLRRALRWLAWAATAGALVLVLAGLAGWLTVRASLPSRQGEARLPGLSGDVVVSFDALGIPTLEASSRADLARATGFVHARDRFFQMDLLRRDAAGELAGMLGPALLPRDRANRRHRFRDLAGRALRRSEPAEREAIEAYAQGVNAGLASLRARPFEYLALRQTPDAWKPEDTLLVTLAMFLALHDSDASRESSVGVLHDLVPGPLFDFLAPVGTSWDAPLTGGPAPEAPLPGAEVVDLRVGAPGIVRHASAGGDPELFLRGSNGWAVSGALTSTGAALLANDMHLDLDVPNIWYRASFVLGGRTITGATLPGAPVMVVGSNGSIAWGFTNSYGDWLDLVELEIEPADPEVYATPGGPRRLEHHAEILRVAGAPDETLDVAWTIWGPVIDQDHRGRRRALRWTAHEERAVNAGLMRLESAGSVEEAIRLAPGIGIPPQNFMVADSAGHIGWTIIGAIPARFGFEGERDARRPWSWADGAHGWDGWLEDQEYPRVVDPPSGRIWTANARVVEGDELKRIGNGGYDLGARAAQIRDDLMQLSAPVTEAAMLQVQLDDRALFLRRWRSLLLDLLTPAAIEGIPRRAEMRRLVEDWGDRAAVDSAGYRLVRAFRQTTARRVLPPLAAGAASADSRFDLFDVGQGEGPLWAILTQRPAHMLDPNAPSWDDALLAAVDAAIASMPQDGAGLARHTWGERNTTAILHPLAKAIPSLRGWLGMPARPLPGDAWMPRVQTPSAGASQRMAVSPGHETQGYFHMPCGQSGHPLSPHFTDGHAAWEEGKATPFLPGPPVSTLILNPG
ncbi:MAG: penicillin acylase family protein [Candidatus Polarisedimenticolia bacterium]